MLRIYPITDPIRKYALDILLDLVGIPWCESSEEFDLYCGNESALSEMASLSIVRDDEIDYGLSFQEVEGFPLPEKKVRENLIAFFNGNKRRILIDIISFAYYFLTRKSELHLPGDAHGRILESPLLERFPFAVHAYADFLQTLMLEMKLIQECELKPRWPNGKKFALALTHDVDYPEIIRWIEIIRTILDRGKYSRDIGFPLRLSTAWNIATRKTSFWQFPAWIESWKKRNIKSAFYFSARSGNLVKYYMGTPDVFYDIKKPQFRAVFKCLYESGFEVGLHASYHAFQNLEEFRKEKTILEDVSGIGRILGLRHHFWHLDPANPLDTLRMHQELGFKYDLSLSFQYQIGSRNGIAFPFYPYCENSEKPLDVLEMTTTIMDHQVQLSSRNAQHPLDIILSHFNKTRKWRGLAVADWHVRTLEDDIFEGWGSTLLEAVDAIVDDAWIATPNEITAWYKERRTCLDRNNEKC